MKIKDLKSIANDLATDFGLSVLTINALFELVEKGKIAKPEKLFKDFAPKLDIKAPRPFMFFNMGMKKYFFLDSAFPVGSDLTNALALTKKQLAKAKSNEKEYFEKKEFFLKKLQKLDKKIKGYATGSMVFKLKKDDACFMLVKQGATYSGKIKKLTLSEDIKDVNYDLKAKNGQSLAFFPLNKLPKTETQESGEEESASSPEVAPTPSPQSSKKTTSEKPKQTPKTPSKGKSKKDSKAKAKIVKNLKRSTKNHIKAANSLKGTYNRKKQESVYTKTKEWIAEYEGLESTERRTLKDDYTNVKKVHAFITKALEIDNSVTTGVEKLYTKLDEYLKLEQDDSTLPQQEKELNVLLDKLVLAVKRVNDKKLLKECEKIKALIA